MGAYATTKMSSKGQVVIPEEVRDSLNLHEGDQFVVIGKGDTVILKAITPPKMDEFEALLAKSREYAKKAGLKQSEVARAIKRVRRESK